MKIHANGYLVKPFAAEDVQREINYLKTNQEQMEDEKKLLKVQCFGNFDVFCKSGVLTFKRNKTKELFAYLVDRRGAMINAGELCAVLWPDNFDERSNVRYLMQLMIDLRRTLQEADASEVLISERRKGYAIDCKKIDCDYYRYLNGDEEAIRIFQGEYMQQYDWGEVVALELQRKNN